MHGMAVAERTVFLILHPTGLLALVLGDGVVTALTLAASKGDDVAWHISYLKCKREKTWTPVIYE